MFRNLSFFLLVLMSSCHPVMAQTTDIVKVRVSDFSGGQNSKDFFDKLDVNQGVVVQNADISSKGQAVERQGQALFITDVGSTAFSGLGAYYLDSTTSYHMVASGSTIVRNGTDEWTKISTSSMGTGFDTGFVQANGTLFVYNGSANTAWWDGTIWTSGGTYPTSPPVATTSAWLANYLFLAGNPTHTDWVYFSSNLVPTSFPAVNIRKINTGDGQAVKRLVPFRLSELIVYKERSIFDLDISADPSTTGFTVTPISKDVGTPAPRSVVFLGNDQWFLSSPPYAIRALTRTQFDKILVDIMSRPIQDIFDGTGVRTLNTVQVEKAAAILYENKYILAIPTGASSVNDFVVVYDFLTKSWWTIDGWYPKDWLVKDNILYYTDANDGRVVKCFTGTTGDFGVVHSSTSGPTTAISYEYASRGIDFGYPENYKNLDSIGVEFFPTGNYDATISINIDNGGWQSIGTVNLLGNSLTLPFTLPATLMSEGLTIKLIPAQQYGKFKRIQVKAEMEGTDQVVKLQAIDIYARIRPWNRSEDQ